MASAGVLALVSLVVVIRGSAGVDNYALETNDVRDHFISANINFLFDLFLKHYKNKLIEDGKTQVEIGGFERRFSTKFLSLHIEGAIVVDDGVLGNLSSLERTGDAKMDKVAEDFTLSVHLGLTNLKIDFNDYDLSLLGEHQKGEIHSSVGTNSLFLELTVNTKPSCVISLSALQIEQLDDIKVDITNLGIFENLTDEITSWVVNEVTKKYRAYVQDTLYPQLAKVVRDADLCHYLPI